MLKRIAAIPLITIILISLFLKMAFFLYIAPWQTKVEKEKIVISDSWGYEQMAENLLKYKAYCPPADTFHIENYSDYQLTGYAFLHYDTFRTPAYPTFMATIYFLAGIKPYLVIFFQILLSLVSVFYVYKICLLIFNNFEFAKLSTLIFALDIHSAYVANQLLTDTLFVLFFLASTFYFLKAIETGKLFYIVACAYFMGVACLTRPVVLFYPSIAIVLLLAIKQSIGWKFKASIIYLLIFLGIAGTWSYRNYEQYGHFKMTTEDGSGLLMYYAAYADARISHRNIDTVRVQYQKEANVHGFKNEKDIFKQSDIYKTIAVDYIKKNKVAYVKTHLLGGINMFFAIGNVGMAKVLDWDDDKQQESFAEISTKRVLGNFTNHKRETVLGIFIILIMALQYIGALIGCITLFKNKKYFFLVLFLLTAGYFTVITGVVGTYRYKLVVVPFICIAAGYGYTHLRKKKELPTRNEALPR